jgi:hypothetical protein
MKDPFDFLKFSNSSISQNSDIRGTVGSAYKLFMAIGVIGILVSIVIFGLTIAFAKPQKRAEAIDEMKWKVLIAIVLFAMTSVVGWVMGAVAGFA